MDKVSVKQGMMLVVVGLLSPVIRILPGEMTARGGEASWLGAVFALIPAVLVALMVCDLVKRPGEDLTDAVCQAFGTVAGRVICFLLGLWVVIWASTLVRFFGEGFLSTSYVGEPVQLFVTLLLVVVFYAAHKRLCVLARAGQIFFWILIVVVVGVFALTAANIDGKNLGPVTGPDLPGALLAAGPFLGVLSGGVCMALLAKDMVQETKSLRSVVLCVVGLAAVTGVLLFITVGNFGVTMLLRLQTPFFMLIKGISIANLFERVESVVIALWMLTDFVLVTMMVKAAARSFARALGAEQEKSCVTPVLLLILTGSALIASNSFALATWMESILTPINLVVGFVFVPIIWCVVKVRKKLEKKAAKNP